MNGVQNISPPEAISKMRFMSGTKSCKSKSKPFTRPVAKTPAMVMVNIMWPHDIAITELLKKRCFMPISEIRSVDSWPILQRMLRYIYKRKHLCIMIFIHIYTPVLVVTLQKICNPSAKNIFIAFAFKTPAVCPCGKHTYDSASRTPCLHEAIPSVSHRKHPSAWH